MLDNPLVEAIGWTIVHSVWQITIVAYVVVLTNRFLLRRSASARYVVGCAAMVLMALAPLITFYMLPRQPVSAAPIAANEDTKTAPPSSAGIAGFSDSQVNVAAAVVKGDDVVAPDKVWEPRLEDAARQPALTATSSDAESAAADNADVGLAFQPIETWRQQAALLLTPAMSSIVAIWLAGVLLLASRPLLGLYTVRRLRRQGRLQASAKLEAMTRSLCERMGIWQTVEVAQSTMIDVPAVIGAVRPLLLLPAAALCGLSTQQLEAVIAHELAHVRRHDFICNVLQTIVETLLFYHPGVWWVSSMIRRERENCCDDIAVAICRDRAVYANTLVVLNELRSQPNSPVLAANGGDLLLRIRRLAAGDPPPENSSSWFASALLFLALTMAAATLFNPAGNALAKEGPDTKFQVVLNLMEADGQPATNTITLLPAVQGYAESMPFGPFYSNRKGVVELKLPPGKHHFVARSNSVNPTFVALSIKKSDLETTVKLNRESGGYPDLNVSASVQAGKQLGQEFVVLKISNNKEKPYKLQPNDIRFTNMELRVHAPKSQQQAGVVIPPKGQGERVVTVDWSEYVRAGIWSSRLSEPISEPWPAKPAKPGRMWFRPCVGITGAIPIQVSMPQLILNRESIDPRRLKSYTGALRGRFVFEGQRPRKQRIKAYSKRTLDGKELPPPQDHVLNRNKVYDESLVIGDDMGLANVVVWVRNADIPVPRVHDKSVVSLNMRNGRFDPHVAVLSTNRRLVVTNNHKFATNWRLSTIHNQPANVLVGVNSSTYHAMDAAEPLPLKMQSDQHPWMYGWILVRNNPFFAVSNDTGNFEVKGLPPGEWEFQFWHEKSGYLQRNGWPQGRLKVKIGDKPHDLGAIRLTADDLHLPKSSLAAHPPGVNHAPPAKQAPAKHASKEQTGANSRGVLRGRLVLDGPPPPRKVIRPLRDVKAVGDRITYDESLVVADDGGLANVLVYVRDKNIPVAREKAPPARLDIVGLRASPHVFAIQAGQGLVISNKSSVAINANIASLHNPKNFILVRDSKFELAFDKPERGPVRITDNIHPWTSAYMLVHDNPYFAISDAKGNFEIKDLPPGNWEFQFWHETAGYLNRGKWPKGRLKIDIKAGLNQLGVVRLGRGEFDLPEQAVRSTLRPIQGLHPIWQAVQDLDKDRVLRLLDQDVQLSNRTNESGFAPLHWAAMSGVIKRIDLLLDTGADVNVRQAKYGGTALQYAAFHGHFDACELLLDHDADVNSIDNYGRTALMWAASAGHTDVARLLIKRGAKIDAQVEKDPPGPATGKGSTALHFAVEKQRDETVDALLELGANRNIRNAKGHTPFAAIPAPPTPPIKDEWFRAGPFPALGYLGADQNDRMFVAIVSHARAQQILEVSVPRRAVLSQLHRWAMEDLAEISSQNTADRAQVWVKARARAEGQLTESQLVRAKQLLVQHQRHEVFLHPDLAPELKITPIQQKKIAAAWAKHLARVKKLKSDAAPKRPHRRPKSEIEDNDELSGLNAAIAARNSYWTFWLDVREVLTVEQQLAYEKMRGPAVEKRNPNLRTQAIPKTPLVDGVVTQVEKSGALIELSVGSDDGLREGMRLVVFRKSKYIGRTVIRKTQRDRSVAEILKDYRNGDVKVGDRVTTRLAKPRTEQ